MKFRFLPSYFILGVILAFGGNYLYSSMTTDDSTSTQTVTQITVEQGDITDSIEVVGEAQLVDEQSLRFNRVGTVKKVYVKEGQSIKRNQVIAELDDTEGVNSIKDAELGLENAQLSLKQLYDEVDESQILEAKNKILTSENAMELAQKEYDNLISTHSNDLEKLQKEIDIAKKELENSQSSYEVAKQEYETLKKEKENNLNNTLSSKGTTVINIEDSFRSNLAQIEEIVLEADYIMGISDDNEDKNDDYEQFLGAKNQQAKNDAEILVGSALERYDTLEKTVLSYTYTGEREILLRMLGDFLDAYNELYKMTDAVYKTVEGSVVSEGSIGQSDIDSMKSSMASYRSAILSKISTINNNINTLNTLSDTDLLSEGDQNELAKQLETLKSQEISIEKEKNSLTNLEKTYTLTQDGYTIEEESKQRDIESKKNSLEIANISLKELVEGPTEENVAKAQNSIRQAQLKIESATDGLEDYQLIAPFDGVVRKIDYKVGDNLTTDSEKYIYIENPNLLEINVLLDQIDITKVAIGQEAITVFDAYPTLKVRSKIINIDTTPIESSGVVSYEVKIVLDDDSFDKKVLSGMTANIEIVTESRQDVLKVKSSAITESDGKKYVLKLENGQETQVEIQTGMSAGGITEIISGVQKGDILLIKEFAVKETTATSTSLFGPPTNRNRTSSGGGQGGPPGGF